MMDKDRDLEHILQFEKKLGFTFKNRSLAYKCCLHRSYYNEHRDELEESNERLEFLGDAVLQMVTSSYLYKRFNTWDEGDLSSMRSKIVKSSACSDYIAAFDLEPHLILGKGEAYAAKSKGKRSMYADFFEAICGAIFLDVGYIQSRDFILEKFGPTMEEKLFGKDINYKTQLQEKVQNMQMSHPEYELIEEKGPDHHKEFLVELKIMGRPITCAWGGSKKQAQQKAAKQALEMEDLFRGEN